jgi:hypothetical protein
MAKHVIVCVVRNPETHPTDPGLIQSVRTDDQKLWSQTEVAHAINRGEVFVVRDAKGSRETRVLAIEDDFGQFTIATTKDIGQDDKLVRLPECES